MVKSILSVKKFNVSTNNIQGVFIYTAVQWRKVIVLFNMSSLISMLQFNIVNYVSKSNVNFTTYLYSNVSCAITSINGQTAVLGLMAIGSEK